MNEQDAALEQGVIQAMSEALYVVDRDRTITYWNAAAAELTGFPAEEVVGRRCRDGILNHVDDAGASLCGRRCPLSGTMRDGELREVVAYAHHRDGHRIPVAVKAAPLRSADGTIYGAVEVFHDDSRCAGLVEQVANAEHSALTDPLTGLANRRMLERQLLRLADEQARYRQPYAVLFIDIDRFKAVNDRHGHQVGDKALQLVAATLRDCARPSDLVGRWGGEEFLVLLPLHEGDRPTVLAERMRRLVGSSWLVVEGERLHVTVSLGVAVSERQEAVDDVVARADAAMLAAKAAGRNRVVTAEPVS